MSRTLYMGARRSTLALAAALLGLAGLIGAGSAAAADAPAPANSPPAQLPALVRISSSFEVKHASAVLRQVAKLYSAGFVRRDAEQLATQIDALPAEVSRIWDFSAIHKGASYALRVRARLDEFGNVDLDFFSAPEMAAAVRRAVDRYLNARGL